MQRLELAGKRFGFFKVLRAAWPDSEGKWLWHCQCSCGRKRTVRGTRLVSGHTRSCRRCIKIIHGHSGTPEYFAWRNAIRRCGNEKAEQWANYGGRGLRVCRRWQRSCTAFLADMGKRPSKRHSLDRKNNDGNYEPGNARWATKSEQRKNSRPHSVEANRKQAASIRKAWSEGVYRNRRK